MVGQDQAGQEPVRPDKPCLGGHEPWTSLHQQGSWPVQTGHSARPKAQPRSKAKPELGLCHDRISPVRQERRGLVYRDQPEPGPASRGRTEPGPSQSKASLGHPGPRSASLVESQSQIRLELKLTSKTARIRPAAMVFFVLYDLLFTPTPGSLSSGVLYPLQPLASSLLLLPKPFEGIKASYLLVLIDSSDHHYLFHPAQRVCSDDNRTKFNERSTKVRRTSSDRYLPQSALCFIRRSVNLLKYLGRYSNQFLKMPFFWPLSHPPGGTSAEGRTLTITVIMGGECRLVGVAGATPTLPLPYQLFLRLSLLPLKKFHQNPSGFL